MKKQSYLIPLLFFLFVACSGDDDSSKQEEPETQEEMEEELPITLSNLKGKWQIKKTCSFDAFGPITCNDVADENIYFYWFKEDCIFINDRFISEYSNGTYILEEETIYIEMNDNYDISPNIVRITASTLILSGTADDGGIVEHYKKINEL